MQVYEGLLEDFKAVNPVLTIGTFDGVHIGHQKIIERLREEAKAIGGESVLFTFHPHPRLVLYPDSTGLKLLQTRQEKIEKLNRYGLDNIILYPFTRNFSRLTAVEFVRDILVNQIGVKKMVIGYDHHFGKNREGNLDFLRDAGELYDFEVIEIPAQDIDEVNVSSSKTRKALLAGEVATAMAYLSEPYCIKGIVVKGQSRGAALGYPTANMAVNDPLKLIPANGVYVVEVELAEGRRKMGMMNIGTNPTVSILEETTLEVHILDFEQNIYGEEIIIHFLDHIRKEQKFEQLELLTEQLKRDENYTRNYFLAVGRPV